MFKFKVLALHVHTWLTWCHMPATDLKEGMVNFMGESYSLLLSWRVVNILRHRHNLASERTVPCKICPTQTLQLVRKQGPKETCPHSRRTTFRTLSGFTAARTEACWHAAQSCHCASELALSYCMRGCTSSASYSSLFVTRLFSPKPCPYLIAALSFISKRFKWRLDFAAERNFGSLRLLRSFNPLFALSPHLLSFFFCCWGYQFRCRSFQYPFSPSCKSSLSLWGAN